MTDRPRRGVPLAAALLLSLAAGQACGDDDAGGVSTATSTFAADYEQVTENFEAALAEVQADGQAALGGGDDAVLAVYQRLLDASEEALDDYEGIQPPADLRASFERLVDELGRQIEVLDAVVAAARASDDTALSRELQELASVVVEVTNARAAVDRQLEAAGVDGGEDAPDG